MGYQSTRVHVNWYLRWPGGFRLSHRRWKAQVQSLTGIKLQLRLILDHIGSCSKNIQTLDDIECWTARPFEDHCIGYWWNGFDIPVVGSEIWRHCRWQLDASIACGGAWLKKIKTTYGCKMLYLLHYAL